jgi:hypothetical protein
MWLRRLALTYAWIAVFLALGLGIAPGARGEIRCSYKPPPLNRLTVTASGRGLNLGVITRDGPRIFVAQFLGRIASCRGGVPTVRNTDEIRVLARGLSFVDLDLSGGPLAPGATPEARGAPEIEAELISQDFLTGFGVVGTDHADEFRWGIGDGLMGLNLNPGVAADADIDVTATGVEALLVAEGAGGDDTIAPVPGRPGAAVPDGAFSEGGPGDDLLISPRITGGILGGGKGHDRLIGGLGFDLLNGGPGRDRITGARGSDGISGGPGRDRLSGGRGRDSIESRDSAGDRVGCGQGRDRVRADRRDSVRGCERTRRSRASRRASRVISLRRSRLELWRQATRLLGPTPR